MSGRRPVDSTAVDMRGTDDTEAMLSFAKTDELMRRAMRADARAVTRGDVLAPAGCAQTVYPRYTERLAGGRLWDVDGNCYLDFLLGYGPVILGHADERITRAVTEELGRGNCLAPLWSPRQVELTELLCEIVPGAELAYLLKTGSDANSAALRLARIFTQRPTVIRWGYNGWHDWAVSSPAGVPAAVRRHTLSFDYPDPASLDRCFREHPDEIACVLMMPFEEDPCPQGLLAELKAVAHRHGALFVLDEMRSGFRMALGGAQEYFGIQADLSTFSKAMANGYPISAVVGRADVMRGLASTRISSTFYAGPAEMVAALETIRILRETDGLERIWSLGRRLVDGLRRVVAGTGVPAEVVGYPVMPFLRFTDPDPVARERARDQFFTETTQRGVLLHPTHQWFVCAAHTEQDVDQAVQACQDAMTAVAAGSGVAAELPGDRTP
jgi:glutamate-1-semialdehyde aminotransferase